MCIYFVLLFSMVQCGCGRVYTEVAHIWKSFTIPTLPFRVWMLDGFPFKETFPNFHQQCFVMVSIQFFHLCCGLNFSTQNLYVNTYVLVLKMECWEVIRIHIKETPGSYFSHHVWLVNTAKRCDPWNTKQDKV